MASNLRSDSNNTRQQRVKRALSAHSLIGISAALILLLVCSSGTLAVLAPYFERWEQPAIAEFDTMPVAAIEAAMGQYQGPAESSVYVVLPTSDLPRAHLTDGDSEFWLSQQGEILAPVSIAWTEFLRDLHYYLHLPSSVGLIVVSIMGVILLMLCLAGILAHPDMLKSAFRWRRGGQPRLEQVDLHNRLAVWGLPFHLMIGVTGAFFGLLGLLATLAATLYFDGDESALFDAVYGGDPVVQESVQAIQLAPAFAHLQREYPDAQPIYVVAHNRQQPSQFFEIAATREGRLTYSEMFRFHADGRFIGSQGLSDGPEGRQVLYSVYRIHFGQFGPFVIRVLWLLLGMSLVVVCLSGVKSWMHRVELPLLIPRIWSAFCWGLPLALLLSSFAATIAVPVFWFGLLLASSAGLVLRRRAIVDVLSVLLLATLVVRVGLDIWRGAEATLITQSLGLATLCLLIVVWRRRRASPRVMDAVAQGS